MRSKRKKVFSNLGGVLLVLILVSTMLLSACSNQETMDQETESTNNTKTKGDSQTTDASDLDEVTLRIFIPGDEKAGTADVVENLEALTKDRLNAKFEINFVAFGDYQNKLTMMAASGDDYDAAFTADWFGFASMVNKEAFLDVTDMIKTYAPNLYQVYSDKDMLSSASVNGHLYALPWTQIKTSKPVFAYREDIAEEYNVKPRDISTIEGIDAFLTELAAKDTGLNLFDMNISGSGMKGDIVNLLVPKYEYLDLGFHSLYMDLNDPEHKVVALEDTPMFKEAIELAKKWYDAGIINKNALSEKESLLFENSKVFSQKNISERMYEVVNFTDSNAKSAAVEVYPDNKFARDSQMNNAMAINRNAENPERMLMFMDLITTDQEVYDALWYGVEGLTYTIDSTGIIAFGPDEEPSKPLWQGWMGWGFLRSDFVRPTVSRNEDAMANELAYATRNNVVLSPVAGFVPDSDAIKTELVQRDQIFDEDGKLLLAGIINGDVDSSIANYVERQQAAGLDKVIEDVQNQVDAFLAGK